LTRHVVIAQLTSLDGGAGKGAPVEGEDLAGVLDMVIL
jgi:hypothetical protein